MQIPLKEVPTSHFGESVRVLVWDRDLVDMWALDGAGDRAAFRGQGATWHYHRALELTLITRGSGVLCVGDHIGRFTAPDAVLLGRDVPHVWKADGELSGVALQFDIGGGGGSGSGSGSGSGAGLSGIAEFHALERLWARARLGLRWTGATMDALLRLLPRMEGMPALARFATFTAILAALAEGDRDAHELSARTVIDVDSPLHGEGMNRVFDHIMSRFREPLRMEDLVRLSGTSQATFCRRFSKLTGRTFTAYLNALRIQEARQALLDSRRSITDVAFAAGYNNLSHFHAVFRATVGCTPLAFRRRNAAPSMPFT